MIGTDLLRYQLKNIPFICFDMETESLNLHYNMPWDISWLIVKDKEIIEKQQRFPLIKDINISKDAARITRFSKEDYLKNAESAINIYNDFSKFIYDNNYIIVGQNILNFDIYILKNLERYLGIKKDWSFMNRIYDTVCLARAYKLGISIPKNKEDLLSLQYQLANAKIKGIQTNLKALCSLFEIEFDENQAHSGLYDIVKTKEVFEKLIWNLEI